MGLDRWTQRADRHALGCGRCRPLSQICGGIDRARTGRHPGLWPNGTCSTTDEGQRASLRALQDAIAEAGKLLKTDCPTYRPITPVVRIDAMEQRLDAMLRAINIVQPALEKFYGSLTDEQKERFNRLAPVQG